MSTDRTILLTSSFTPRVYSQFENVTRVPVLAATDDFVTCTPVVYSLGVARAQLYLNERRIRGRVRNFLCGKFSLIDLAT